MLRGEGERMQLIEEWRGSSCAHFDEQEFFIRNLVPCLQVPCLRESKCTIKCKYISIS